MQFASASLVLLHLIGFAALLGGVLVQLRAAAPEVNRTMLVGAPLCLVTGIASWVLGSVAQLGLPALIVKTVLAAVATLLVAVNRRFASIPRGLLLLIGLLALADAAVAVYWT